MVIWWLGLLTFVFRGQVSLTHRLLALTLSGFYSLWFYEEWMGSLHYLQTTAAISIVSAAFESLIPFFSLILFLAWPAVLISGWFRSAADQSASLGRLIAFTACFWIVWLLFFFYQPEPAGLIRLLEKVTNIPPPPLTPQ